MKTALIRLEDVGPGGYYEPMGNQAKLLCVAHHLYAQRIPFQVAVIPRFVDPERGVDRSIADRSDPVSAGFVQLLHTLVRCGASLGMHGYTHQYGRAVSADGYEFHYAGCSDNCPPDDSADALTSYEKFHSSYAYRRFASALALFYAAGLTPEWFETPHYAASQTQRRILEACSGLIYEDNPDAPNSRTVTWRRPAVSFAGGSLYVPTPLSYVGGASINADVTRISEQMREYGDQELASFFYHPFLEFPYIHGARYAEHSPLKRLIRSFQADGRRFRSIRQVIHRPVVHPTYGVQSILPRSLNDSEHRVPLAANQRFGRIPHFPGKTV
jgi:hypothetical protein